MMTKELIEVNTKQDAIMDALADDHRLQSRHSKRSYFYDLKQFNEWRGDKACSKRLVEKYASFLLEVGYACTSINRKLCAIRWYARKAADQIWDDPTIDKERKAELLRQATRAAEVENVRGHREAAGRSISSGELKAIINACQDDKPAGLRDACCFALAYGAGLRRGEITAIKLEDLKEISEGEIELLVHGKGNKERKLSIVNGALNHLKDWLVIRGSKPGALFCRIDKGGNVHAGTHLSGEAMRIILNKRIKQSGVNGLTWHDYRRSFIGDLLDQGVDLATVQKLAGHSDPKLTSSYDRRSAEVQRKAIKMLHVPY